MLEIFQIALRDAGLNPILTLHGIDEGRKAKGKRVRSALRMKNVYFIVDDDKALLYIALSNDYDTYYLADPELLDKIIARVRQLNGTVLHVHDSGGNQGNTG